MPAAIPLPVDVRNVLTARIQRDADGGKAIAAEAGVSSFTALRAASGAPATPLVRRALTAVVTPSAGAVANATHNPSEAA